MKNNIRVERAIKNITQGELAEQVGVSREFDLHQSSAKLGDQDKLHPMV